MALRLVTAFAVLGLSACQLFSSRSKELGLYDSQGGWPGGTTIVCFADHAQGTPELRQKVARVVEQEINQRTRFRFTGFKLCSEDRAQLEVRLEARGRSHAGGIGDTRTPFQEHLLSHFIPGHRLREPMVIYLADEIGVLVSPDAMHNIIVHEFGHAMGLHHEQLRSDNAGGVFCSDLSGGEVGVQPAEAVQVGSYDHASVMNYCRAGFFDRKISLSQGDVDTVNTLYRNSGSGENRGRMLRCVKEPLVACINGGGGAGCVERECQGGDYVCERAEPLKACLKGGGGTPCLHEAHGSCRG